MAQIVPVPGNARGSDVEDPGPMTDKLTASEQELITRARELAAAEAPVNLRHYLRERGHDLNPRRATDEFVYKTSFHSAQDLLGQLADLAERLASGSAG